MNYHNIRKGVSLAHHRITSYNVCYTKLLRFAVMLDAAFIKCDGKIDQILLHLQPCVTADTRQRGTLRKRLVLIGHQTQNLDVKRDGDRMKQTSYNFV